MVLSKAAVRLQSPVLTRRFLCVHRDRYMRSIASLAMPSHTCIMAVDRDGTFLGLRLRPVPASSDNADGDEEEDAILELEVNPAFSLTAPARTQVACAVNRPYFQPDHLPSITLSSLTGCIMTATCLPGQHRRILTVLQHSLASVFTPPILGWPKA